MSDDLKMKETFLKVLKLSDSPLKFFMVLEFVLGGIGYALITQSKLPPNINVILTLVDFGIILLIAVGISILLIFFPKKLTFDKEAHLTMLREKLSDSELSYDYDGTSNIKHSKAPLPSPIKNIEEGNK